MWWVPIVVAVITGPLVVLMRRFDKRNTEQHGENLKVLNRIESKVDHIDKRLDDHVDYHLKEGL
jgi:predicted metallo-beta-lactamase superfamily hydrolase